MKSQFWKLTLTGALALVATMGAPLAGADVESPRAFRVDLAGAAYRLELVGSLTDASQGFEATLYPLPGKAGAAAGSTTGRPPVSVERVPFAGPDAGERRLPDAVWSVRPEGALTSVTIRVGPDLLEALLPAHDSLLHRAGEVGICGPYDHFPGPVWVEVNGVPVDVPQMIADVEQSPAAAVANERNRAPLEKPESFFDGFARLQAAVLATLGPAATDIDTLAKRGCTAPCLGCAAGILRVAGMAGATALACSSAVTTAGTTLGGCVLAMVFAHATVIEAGLRCGACDACRSAGHDTHGHDDRDSCECSCRGEPLCDCAWTCPIGDDDDLPFP